MKPKSTKLFPYAVLLLAGLAAAGCLGRGQEVDLTAGEISDGQLASMTLALEDFGPDFRGFVPDEDSGPRTAKQVAEDDFDPQEEAGDLERFGWASGWEQNFVDPKAAAEQSGIFIIGSSVDLFESAEGSAGYFEDTLAEFRQMPGKTSEGATIEESTTFATDMGDQAAGLHFRGRVEGEDGSTFSFFASAVAFRHGRLLATVSIGGFEERTVQEHLKGLAQRLDDQILNVLSGTTERGPAVEPLVARPGAVLATSADRFTEDVETFQGVFEMTLAMDGFSFTIEGRLAFRAPDALYMTMAFFGDTMELLMVSPDVYIRVPGEGWYVMTAESIGIDREAFQEYMENRGVLDYPDLTGQLDDLTRLPDEAIDGVTYLHYEGTLDYDELLADLPEGVMDPAVLDEVKQFLQPLPVELWLYEDSLLPRKMTAEITMDGQGQKMSVSISMDFLGYNEPVSIPEPPEDAEPFEGF